MSRIGKRVLLFCLLLFLLASACGGDARPSAAPSASPIPKPVGTFDMKPVIRNFLANMPEAWGLAISQNVAKTKPFIVDVRQPDEYGKGFIGGAVNIPLRELTRNLQALPGLDQEIVLVCNTGHRSALGMVALQLLGYKKAKSLAGGMQMWQTAKLAVVTQPVPKRPSGPSPNVDAKLLAALDQYLTEGLPDGWGTISPASLAEDQTRKSTLETETQPETYDQGASFLIDVSEPDEFAKATLPRAINIPFRELPDNLEKLPADKITLWFCGVPNEVQLERADLKIVTICRDGHRGIIAMMTLQLLGFKDVRALEGGLKAWNAAAK